MFFDVKILSIAFLSIEMIFYPQICLTIAVFLGLKYSKNMSAEILNEDFVDNGDGTVTSKKHGLMWVKTDSMNDLKKWVNYQESKDYARELSENKFAGYDDWRLPNKDEMSTLYHKNLSNTDQFGKTIHISDRFSSGGGFSMVAQQVPGRMRTWVLNIRDGEFNHPEGLWTITEAARAVRKI